MTRKTVLAAVAALPVLAVAIPEAAAGWRARAADNDPAAQRRREVLAKLVAEPNTLVNLEPYDVPATGDLIRLGRPATPAIINGLVNSMNASVRGTCATVLAAVRDPAALDALVDALDDPDDDVRVRALQALATLEARKATPRLLQLLAKKTTPPAVRGEAVLALGRMGDPAAIRPLAGAFKDGWSADAQRALWDLRRLLAPPDLEALVVPPLRAGRTERAPGEDVLGFAVERAGDLKLKAAVGPLRDLAETVPDLQNRIIYNLGRIGDRQVVPWLKGLIDRTSEARLLNNVLFALQRLGDDPAPLLREALADRRAYIRYNAAYVAGDIGAKALVPELSAALVDANDYVRSEAAVALGRIGDARAIPALEKAAAGQNPVVQRDALVALATLDYAKFGPRVVSELLASDVASVRQKAARFLAQRRDPAVVPPVLSALDADDWQDRRTGLELLERFDQLDSPDATAFLLRLAPRDRDAVRLLARLRDPRAQFALRQWAKTPSPARDQLLRALGRLGDRESAPLAQALATDASEPGLQLHAAFLLASLGEKQGADVLLGSLQDAPVELKRTTATLLTEVDAKKVPALGDSLAKLLDHPDVYVRLYAARALAGSGDAKAWARLKTELDRKIPFVQDEVLDIAERAPRAVAEPRVREWLKASDPLLAADLRALLEPPAAAPARRSAADRSVEAD